MSCLGQDPVEEDLWINDNELLVDTAALEERTNYFEVPELVRLPAQVAPAYDHELLGEHILQAVSSLPIK